MKIKSLIAIIIGSALIFTICGITTLGAMASFLWGCVVAYFDGGDNDLSKLRERLHGRGQK